MQINLMIFHLLIGVANSGSLYRCGAAADPCPQIYQVSRLNTYSQYIQYVYTYIYGWLYRSTHARNKGQLSNHTAQQLHSVPPRRLKAKPTSAEYICTDIQTNHTNLSSSWP